MARMGARRARMPYPRTTPAPACTRPTCLAPPLNASAAPYARLILHVLHGIHVERSCPHTSYIETIGYCVRRTWQGG